MGRTVVEIAADDLDRLIGIPEAAARLALHADTARAWIRTGRWQQEYPTIPVLAVGGKHVVSLRRLVELINSSQHDIEAAS